VARDLRGPSEKIQCRCSGAAGKSEVLEERVVLGFREFGEYM